MKFGLGEIILILIITFIVLLAVRIMKMAQTSSPAGEEEYTSDEDYEEPAGEPQTKSRTRGIIVGAAIAVLGIIILVSSLSLVKWVMWGSVGSVIAILAGAAIIVIARRS